MKMNNLLDWDVILEFIRKEDEINEEADFQEYLAYIKKFDLEQFKWAASETSEINDIRRRIGAEFEKFFPITLKLYSAELYVLDQNSALLTLMKGGKIASDLNGKIIDFFLTENPSTSFSEAIQDGEVIINFQRLGVSIEDYKAVSFRLHLDESTVIDGSLFNGKCQSD
jgi:hypothetical protein